MSKRYTMNAYAMGSGCDLARILKRPPYPIAEKERNLVILQPAGEAFVFVYSFGAVVSFNLPQSKKVVSGLKKFMSASFKKWYEDEYALVVGAEKNEVTFDEVRITEFSLTKLTMVATVLAQSVAIEHVEDLAERVMRQIAQINLGIEQSGKLQVSAKTLTRTLATTGLITQRILSGLALLDKPDVLWEEAELETLFAHMRKMYELEDRFKTLQFKLASVEDDTGTLLGILQERRAGRLELVIIILIAVEILIYLFDLWYR